jgi:hypothetical protein
VRKFGRFRFVEDSARELADLGPEPLRRPSRRSGSRTSCARDGGASSRCCSTKQFLAGMGNIYTDECLHQAGIHPLARSDRVDDERVRRLHASIQKTLRAAIAREGSSFDTFYRTPEGQPGGYQDQFQVYGREGEPCASAASRSRACSSASAARTSAGAARSASPELLAEPDVVRNGDGQADDVDRDGHEQQATTNTAICPAPARPGGSSPAVCRRSPLLRRRRPSRRGRTSPSG